MPAPAPLPRPGRRALLGWAGAGLLAGALGGSLAGCGEQVVPDDIGPLPDWQQRLRSGSAGTPRRIVVLGDSISFGGGAVPGGGSSAPKYRWSYAGQLRAALQERWGETGSGWVLLNHVLWPETDANRGWDPRLRVVGEVAQVAAGPFRKACAGLPDSAGGEPTGYVELTARGATFSTLVQARPSGDSRLLVSVDGGPPAVLRNVAQGGPQPDHEPRSAVQGRLWTDVPTGSPGGHTVRVWADGGPAELVAVRTSGGDGLVDLDLVAVSGESLATFLGPAGADASVQALFGLPWLDALRADLLLVELGANDYNAGRPLAEVEVDLRRLLERQAATGGDAALLFPPVSTPALHRAGTPTYTEYATMFGTVAADTGTPYLDLTRLWGADYAESAALEPPRYADGIHPTDVGAGDIASQVERFLAL